MIRSIVTVSSGTLASRLLGFVRDAMVAALLGAGPVADAFLMAFQLINVVRRLLTEGALNAALVPAWLRAREADGAVAAAAFAGHVLGTIGLALVVAALILGIAMPVVIGLLAPGFAGHPTLPLAVDNARLMMPYLAFAGPVAVMMGLLNAQHRFALTAFSPLLFNAALIGMTAILLVEARDASTAATMLAATVGVAGLLQLGILAMRRGENFATPLRVSFNAPMRAFFRKALPGMVANSGPQLLIVAGAVIASSSPSAVSWLYFASRLIELPLGIVGVAMGTVLVPELTRAVSADDRASVVHAKLRALELALGLALPATLALIVLSLPIVQMLFEHGAYTRSDTKGTAQALMLLALGLPAHVVVKTLSPAFFARGDTITPMLATLKGIAVAFVAAIVFGRLFHSGGVAASIALGAWSTAFFLMRRASSSFGFSVDTAARWRLPRIILTAIIMSALVWLATALIWPLVAGSHSLAQAAVLAVIIAVGMAIYLALLLLLRVVNGADAIRAFKRPAPDLRA